MFKTTCEKCIFAQYNADETVQIGCYADRLDKFSEQKITSFVANPDKSHYVINGRKCNICHQQAWTDYQNNQLSEPLTLDQLYDTARQQVRPKIVVSIYCTDNNINLLQSTLQSLYDQEIRPYRIHIINVEDSYEIVQLMQDKFNKIPWKVIRHSMENNIAKQLDDSFKDTKGQFYAMIYSGSICPDDWFNMIDLRVNVDLEMLFYDYISEDCMLVQSILYWMLPPDWLEDSDQTVNKIQNTLKELSCPTPSASLS